MNDNDIIDWDRTTERSISRPDCASCDKRKERRVCAIYYEHILDKTYQTKIHPSYRFIRCFDCYANGTEFSIAAKLMIKKFWHMLPQG